MPFKTFISQRSLSKYIFAEWLYNDWQRPFWQNDSCLALEPWLGALLAARQTVSSLINFAVSSRWLTGEPYHTTRLLWGPRWTNGCHKQSMDRFCFLSLPSWNRAKLISHLATVSTAFKEQCWIHLTGTLPNESEYVGLCNSDLN